MESSRRNTSGGVTLETQWIGLKTTLDTAACQPISPRARAVSLSGPASSGMWFPPSVHGGKAQRNGGGNEPMAVLSHVGATKRGRRAIPEDMSDFPVWSRSGLAPIPK